jgi:hypothetical protein
MNPPRYFKTSSFNLAVFLITKGLQLFSIEKEKNSNRLLFVFSDELPQRVSLTHAFNFAPDNDPEALVDARELMTKMKNLKDKLYLAKNSS